jgi:hypothetical protein
MPDLQIRWGQVGMVAIRAGLCGIEDTMLDVVVTNMYRAPAEGVGEKTRLSCSWKSQGVDTPVREAVMENGALITTASTVGARLDACLDLRQVVQHTIFRYDRSRAAAGHLAEERQLTSFVDDQLPRASSPAARVEREMRHNAIAQQITPQGLLSDFPSLVGEMAFWRYYSSDFNPHRRPGQESDGQ